LPLKLRAHTCSQFLGITPCSGEQRTWCHDFGQIAGETAFKVAAPATLSAHAVVFRKFLRVDFFSSISFSAVILREAEVFLAHLKQPPAGSYSGITISKEK
jgi:hypothetical protein